MAPRSDKRAAGGRKRGRWIYTEGVGVVLAALLRLPQCCIALCCIYFFPFTKRFKISLAPQVGSLRSSKSEQMNGLPGAVRTFLRPHAPGHIHIWTDKVVSRLLKVMLKSDRKLNDN